MKNNIKKLLYSIPIDVYEDMKEKEKGLRSKYTDEEYIQRLKDALLVCEYIAIHQADLPKNLNTDKERELHNAIRTVYRVAHIATFPSCFDKHLQWEKEFQKLKEFAKHG